MTAPPEIHDLDKLVEPHLNGVRIISHKSRFLTSPGENYGSTMLAVTAIVQSPTGKIEELELVAKMPPLSNFYWEMFQPTKTFITENNIYVETIPALRKFQLERNVHEDDITEFFPKCYGARLSLDENFKKVDKNATLILENVAPSGFRGGSRLEGFDYEHTVVILKHLAKFHAWPIALRILQPKVFKEKIVDCIKPLNILKYMDPDIKDGMNKSIVEDMRSMPEIDESITDRIPEFIEMNERHMENTPIEAKGLFDTLVHHDFWVNNMLILYDDNGKPIKIKIIDFQLVRIDSLIQDLIFFLFSSVKYEILKPHYDEFLKIYYDQFIDVLEKSDCPRSDYSYEKFLKEVKNVSPLVVSQILTMLKVLFMEKEAAPSDFSDMDADVFTKKNSYGSKYFNKLRNNVLMLHELGVL